MVHISDLMKPSDLTSLCMTPGMVLLGEMKNVDHLKFFVIAGVCENKVSVCSVVINSKINTFVLRNEHVKKAQVLIHKNDYKFLSHDSYIDCAQPYKKDASSFEGYKIVGVLTDTDLESVRRHIIAVGTMSMKDMEFYGLV